MNFLINWFQLGPLPTNRLEGHFDTGLVLLSYIVAVLASYVTLTLVARLREEPDKKTSYYWLIGGAFTLGAGIWSMHFIGMMAFILPMAMDYELSWTLASLFMAMLGSGMALVLLQKKPYKPTSHLILGGLLIGLAISSMHYMGMEGMKSHVNIRYVPSLFFLSIIIGIVAAETALWLALESNKGSINRKAKLKIGSALIMGFAISGMHYMGMAASVFTSIPNHYPINGTQGIEGNNLALLISMIAAFIFSLALILSSSYKRMIDAVQNEKEFLNAMLDNLEDGIIACDENGQITVLNHAIQKNISVNFPANKLYIGDLPQHYQLYAENVLVGKDEYPLKRIFRGETIRKLPLVMKFESGQIDVILDGQPIINRDGRFLGGVMVIHNVTELRRIEKIKNEFIAVISHELRTPLVSIKGSLMLLVNESVGQLPAKAKDILTIANNNCERLILLINDILDFEKIEAGKMAFQFQDINLNKLIQEAIDENTMYAQHYSVSLQVEQFEEGSLITVADPGRLMQVLTNLISNACKVSPPNGVVTVLIKKMGDKVRLSIIDKGPGIPQEFQKRIFYKFSQGNSSESSLTGGTGLGLYISKNILERMGVVLDYESSANGSNFYFDLPLKENNV